MDFASHIREVGEGPRTLRVFTDPERETDAEAIARLEAFFEGDVVTIEEVAKPDIIADLVAFPDREDAVAVTTLDEIDDSVLLVDSQLGVIDRTSPTVVPHPAVVARIDKATFPVRGGTKRLLIRMSKFVERIALSAGEGRLYAGFQTLSRFEGEAATRERYELVGLSDVDVYVFGAPDVDPAAEPFGVTVCGRDTEEIRRAWFVVFDDERGGGAALLAEEQRPDVYRGFWSFESRVIARIAEYVSETFRTDC